MSSRGPSPVCAVSPSTVRYGYCPTNNQRPSRPHQARIPDLLAHTATSLCISPSSSANTQSSLALCRYSYATSVKPNCGLLRIMRAGPPLKNALKPSSRSDQCGAVPHVNQPRSAAPFAQKPLTDLHERVRKALVVRLARPSFNLQPRLHNICMNGPSVWCAPNKQG